jgi:NDP-sugar pyrophosphorylase family protein
MAVAAVPYYVDIPYAVLETNIDNEVLSLKEKPRYIYYSNAGIYLFKKELINLIPKDEFFNATDLMEKVIAEGRKLINFPILNYWLDIGKMPDYLKAQEDIKHLQL